MLASNHVHLHTLMQVQLHFHLHTLFRLYSVNTVQLIPRNFFIGLFVYWEVIEMIDWSIVSCTMINETGATHPTLCRWWQRMRVRSKRKKTETHAINVTSRVIVKWHPYRISHCRKRWYQVVVGKQWQEANNKILEMAPNHLTDWV